mgnify:CR=1 FL=1
MADWDVRRAGGGHWPDHGLQAATRGARTGGGRAQPGAPRGAQAGEEAPAKAWAAFRSLGRDKPHLRGIQDASGDVEGYVYGELQVTAAKRDSVAQEREKHARARLEMFGSTIQPIVS